MACLEPYQSFTLLSLFEVICLDSAYSPTLPSLLWIWQRVSIWWCRVGLCVCVCGGVLEKNSLSNGFNHVIGGYKIVIVFFYRFLVLFCNIVYASITEYLPFGSSYWNHHQENSFVGSKSLGSIWNKDLPEHDLDVTKCLSQNCWASNVACDKTLFIIKVSHLLAPKLSRVCGMPYVSKNRSWIMLVLSLFMTHFIYVLFPYPCLSKFC